MEKTFVVRNAKGAAHELRIIRDANGLNWTDLCRKLGHNADQLHTGHYDLIHKLERLIEANLLVTNIRELIARLPNNDRGITEAIGLGDFLYLAHRNAIAPKTGDLFFRVTDHLREIQSALGISITE